MPDRSRDWLDQAERDLQEARWSMEGGFFEWTCFIAQQAAEKGVKGLYQSLHGEAWGHSVSKLLAALPEQVRPGEELLARAVRLDRYYIPTRYPNGFDVGSPKDYFTRSDAEGALEDARAILDYCQDIFPGRREGNRGT